jgi:hypothetical protein
VRSPRGFAPDTIEGSVWRGRCREEASHLGQERVTWPSPGGRGDLVYRAFWRSRRLRQRVAAVMDHLDRVYGSYERAGEALATMGDRTTVLAREAIANKRSAVVLFASELGEAIRWCDTAMEGPRLLL